MKTRRVVISLIFVVAVGMAACDSEPKPPDQSRNANNAASPATDEATKNKLTEELTQAVKLLDKAETELTQDDEAQAKAKRILGYPLFIVDDFIKPEDFVSILKSKNRGELSDHLVKDFKASTKKLFDEAKGDRLDPELLAALTAELNEQLKRRDLYNQDRFPAARLTQATISELRRPAEKRLPQELGYLNRRLLEDSYRGFIKQAPTETVLSHLQNTDTLSQRINISELPSSFQSSLNAISNSTRALLEKQSNGADLSANDIQNFRKDVTAALESLRSSNPSPPGLFEQIIRILWEVLYYLLLILVVVVPLALIAFFIKRARDNAAAKELVNLQAFKKIIDRHDHLQQEFISFKNQSTSELEALKDQISRLESAYRILARKTEQSANSSSANFQNADRYYEPPPPPVREEPEFPVSAETYLQKMKGSNRSTTVIRPDFQNGILVKDGEGRGELVLVEDLTRPVDFQRLFVVPSVSQFQMKQDFYNYYDGYYECDQPTAGDVWILHPAIVEKVNGGWRLREKGRLEVRS
jgi:hypothetical protein